MAPDLKKNNHGFSLIELLVYIAIMSGFVFIIVNIFFMISTSSQKEEARADVQQNLRFAIKQITDELHSSNSGIIVNAPANNNSGNVLNFTVGGTTTEFRILNGVLQKIRGAEINDITNNKVTVNAIDPVFTRIDNSGSKPTIQIILKISYNDMGRPNYSFSQTDQTTISLRQ